MKIIVFLHIPNVAMHRLIGVYGFWQLLFAWRALRDEYGSQVAFKIAGW